MISVIIPVYNVADCVERCLRALHRQTYSDFEALLIDDGSTDASAAVCEAFCKDSRFRVIRQRHAGVSAARNCGLQEAAGEYVLFLDADDWPADNMLERLISEIGDADLAMCRHYVAEQRGDGTYEYFDYWPKGGEVHAVQDKYLEIVCRSVTLWNKLIRRSVIGETRFDESLTYGEDAVFCCEIIRNVRSAVIVPEYLYYYYRNREGNVVSAAINEKSLELLRNAKRIFDLCASDGDAAVGIRRMRASVGEVQEKIPPRWADLRQNRVYLNACRDLMRYPSFSQFMTCMKDGRISARDRLSCALVRFDPFYFYWQAGKKRILDTLRGRK